MTTLAFLQNQYVKPHRVEYFASLKGQRRAAFLRLLLRHSRTGTVLLRYFTDDEFSEVIWENATPVVADNPNDALPPDRAHIRRAIKKHSPDVILVFGVIATKAVDDSLTNDIRVISAQHPASRHRWAMKTIDKLVKDWRHFKHGYELKQQSLSMLVRQS